LLTLAEPRGRIDTFRALRHRNYRLYFCGQIVSLTGSWVQSAALTWLAYALTQQSRWPALIGAAQVLPTFLLGVWGGSLADRWPKRSLIFVCQAILLVLALLLAGLVLLDHATPWNLLVISIACGIVNAVDLPARLSFVIEMVGREDLLNAVALNALQFNTARAVGPAVSAMLLPLLGPGLCFLMNGLSFLAILLGLGCMHLPPPVPHEARKQDSSLLAGFRHLGEHPGQVLLLVLSGALALFGWPVLSLLPAYADQVLHVSEQGYGWMLSAIGVGALLASLAVASFGSLTRRRVFLGAGVLLSALALGGLAQMRSLAAAIAFCAVLGCGLILFFATGQAVLQLSSTDHNRGRIMGIWSMILSGAHPLGHLIGGWAADRWGVSWVLAGQSLGIAWATGIVLVLALVWRARGERP
jgi:MFS family permease